MKRRWRLALTRVEYWEKWRGEEWEAMAALARAFNAAQGTYEVVMTPAGDWSSSPDLPRFLRAQGEGAPPDLIGLEDQHVVDLAEQEALAPLDELVGTGPLARAGFRDAFLRLSEHRGTLYGVPISADVVTLYVNLKSARGTPFEGGVVPAGLEAFDAGLEELRRQGKVGLVPTYPGWWPQAWVFFFGGDWYDARGRFVPDQPANVRAYDWVASFRQRFDLAAFADPVHPIGARDPDPFLQGEVAFVLEGDWLVRRLTKTPDLKWAPAAVPTVCGRPASLIVADLLCVPRGARHPEGAAAFVSFLLEPTRIEQLALGQGKVSPLSNWSAGFRARHPNPHLEALGKILTSADLFHDPRVPGWLATLERIKAAFALIWAGSETVPAALARLRRAD